MKFKLEYIWLDGDTPEPNLRSKTKIIDDLDGELRFDELPEWSFDGSSTKQAEGNHSDCILKPVKMVRDPGRHDAFLVMCEVLNSDGTPHKSNTRANCPNETEYWFGFEQEYTLMNPETQRPIGFPMNGYPEPQGEYYCGVGTGRVTGREIMEEHLDTCLLAGLDITGVNFEVMLGQSEYQVLGKGSRDAADDLWISRYLLYRITEKYGVEISFHPKPVKKANFNGSGCHCNFSNKAMRDIGGQKLMEDICKSLEKSHKETMKVYGSDNHERLTGEYETQSIDKFSYGVSDRGASIRIPISVPADDWKGYLEDRRPSSNCDPYKVVKVIVEACQAVKYKELTSDF